ncbi:MAG TPA: hypothetical protein DEB31_08500 [Clostridiales bacterium]|nr:hypothetical protein [Clostridiales bacterium]
MNRVKVILVLSVVLLLVCFASAGAAQEPVAQESMIWEGSSDSPLIQSGSPHKIVTDADGNVTAYSSLVSDREYVYSSKKAAYADAEALILNKMLFADVTTLVIDEVANTCTVTVKGAKNVFYETTPEQEIDRWMRESLEQNFGLKDYTLNVKFE